MTIHDFTDGELASEISRRNQTGYHFLDRDQGWVHETWNPATEAFECVPVATPTA